MVTKSVWGGGWEGLGVKHPSLSDIKDREAEIATFDKSVDRYAYCSHVRLWAIAVLCVITSAFLMLGSLLSIVSLVLFVAVLLAHIFVGPPPVLRPEPLGIVKFSPSENAYFLARQDWTEFQTHCACPGCGHEWIHGLADDFNKPWWAALVRKCDVCDREWAQA